MIRNFNSLALLVVLAAGAGAQTPAHDPSAKLREVLPADVADRVLAKIAEARSRSLPAAALEDRALKLAAQGAKPAEIEQSVADHSQRMDRVSQTLLQARGRRASDGEVDAGAEAVRMGVDGAAVSQLAKSASSGRSLAVPLLVIGSLVNRGLPSDEALQRVQARLEQRASDADLQAMANEIAGKPAETGRDLADTKLPEGAGRPATAGRPTSVPANAGSGARPTSGTMPSTTKKPAPPPRP